jgi:hypothetical protein
MIKLIYINLIANKNVNGYTRTLKYLSIGDIFIFIGIIFSISIPFKSFFIIESLKLISTNLIIKIELIQKPKLLK